MEPTKDLLDALYRERVLRARRTPPEQKFLDGAQLFTAACQRMLAGIRREFPEADDRRAQEILTQRLALLQRLRDVRGPGTMPSLP
jgi:hypothetical protein